MFLEHYGADLLISKKHNIETRSPLPSFTCRKMSEKKKSKKRAAEAEPIEVGVSAASPTVLV